MSNLKEFGTIKIRLPRKLMAQNVYGTYQPVNTLTNKGKISSRKGLQSINLSALGNDVLIESEGTTYETSKRGRKPAVTKQKPKKTQSTTTKRKRGKHTTDVVGEGIKSKIISSDKARIAKLIGAL